MTVAIQRTALYLSRGGVKPESAHKTKCLDLQTYLIGDILRPSLTFESDLDVGFVVQLNSHASLAADFSGCNDDAMNIQRRDTRHVSERPPLDFASAVARG